MDRDHVVAVDLVPGMPAAIAFCASVAAAVCALRGTEIAHWLLLITNTAGSRQAPASVDRLVEGALRGRAVAEDADRDARLAPELERIGDAHRVQALAGDRHATGKSARGPAKSLPRSSPPQ